MAEYPDTGGVNYPPEYVSPKDKEKRDYGLQYAKAMLATSKMPSFYYDDSEYQALIEIAQGRQSVENIRKLFGHFTDPNDVNDDGSESLAYLDIQVLNLAPKYINRAVAKMQKYSYDIALNAIDPVSVDEKIDTAATIQAFYRLNDFIKNIGFDPKEYFPDIDVDSLPKYPDEMLYDIETNPKIKKEISGELALKLLHYVNNFKQVMREVDWDIVVIGKGHLHCYLDDNGVPRVDRLNTKFVFGSYVDNEDFESRENAAYYDFITANQLRKELLADGFSEEQCAAIIQRYSSANTSVNNTYYGQYYQQYDGLNRIPILRFYFKSEDNRSFVSKKSENYGFEILLEKNYNYQPDEALMPEFESGDRKLIKNSYTSIYGGAWILDSDVVFGYGRKNYPRLNLVNATLPIVTFSPNQKEGRTVSFTSQMIEPLNMANVAWNKIKEIIAKGWMGVREIDFTQLENVAMGKGGSVWKPYQVYKHLLQTNTMVKRSSINRHDQNYASSAVEDKQTGLMLSDYFTTFNTAIQILEQMTSTSVVDSMQVPDRLSATAAKQSAMTSDVDMEWLYNAHENIYQQGSHILLLLLQETKKSGAKVAGFIPALGKVNMGYFEVPDDLAYCEYGLMMSRQPTAEEWASFYQDVTMALQNQEISIADSAFIREIDNLKQARQILVIRNKQHQRQLKEDAKFNNDLAIQSNQAAAQSKMQGEMQVLQAKTAADKEIENLKGMIKMKADAQKFEYDKVLKDLDTKNKERVKVVEGRDRMITQAQKNTVENKRVDVESQKVMVADKKVELDAKKPEAKK